MGTERWVRRNCVCIRKKRQAGRQAGRQSERASEGKRGERERERKRKREGGRGGGRERQVSRQVSRRADKQNFCLSLHLFLSTKKPERAKKRAELCKEG